MERILYFDMCAFFVIIALLFSVFYHRMTRGVTNRAFIFLMINCLATIIFDIGSEIFGMTIPMSESNLLIDEILTYGYYIFRPLTALSYMIYLISLTDTWHKIAKSYVLKSLLVGPYVIIMLLLVANLFSNVVFYYNEQLEYTRGKYFYIVHACALFYLVFGIYYAWKYRVIFSKGKLLAIISMFPLALVSVVVQAVWPGCLVEMFATTMAILLMIIMIQRPDENMHAYFGIGNNQAYWNDLKRAFYNQKPIDILFINIMNYDAIISILGEEVARELFKMLIAPIFEICKKHKARVDLYYLNHGCIAIVHNEKNKIKADLIAKEINYIARHDKSLRKSGVAMITQICILRCPEEAKDFKEASIMYNVLKNQTESIDEIIYASDLMKQKGFEVKSKIDSIINDALENNQFEIYYQPIYSTEQKRFHSAEALIRLKHEEYGFISPEIFIPASEKSGEIHQIGIFVFEEICKFIKSDEFEELGLDYIEINLSVVQCMQSSLANDLLEILHKYDVSPDKINLEITETAMASSHDTMMDNLNILAKEGITFSLDDYGTGFSNIQRIITMPLSIVKLDKSFIDKIHNPDYQVIMSNTIKMLKDLNLKIVSEGVEGENQLGFLNEQECDYIQGYYFSKPLPKEEFTKFLKQNIGKVNG